MAIFITGGTGYIGSYAVANLLERTEEPLFLLTRNAGPEKLWRSLQFHVDPERFHGLVGTRLIPLEGDLTKPALGLSPEKTERVVAETTSIIHCAASLNRKSEKACLNVNLRGTLGVIDLARAIQERNGLRRLSYVSTVAVAGQRRNEIVEEDAAIDWTRSDYDPYGRTKKFCEHMLRTLLSDVSVIVLRPSVVLGDSRRPETTQFDMVRAFAFLARRSVLPLRGRDRLDIVPANYVGDAIATLHEHGAPEFDTYHLSAGRQAPTYKDIVQALSTARGTGTPWFWPWLEKPYAGIARRIGSWFYGTATGTAASRLTVFWPYLTYNTVFDNSRIVKTFGHAPAAFPSYCAPMLDWSLRNDFRYPYQDLPA